MKKAQIAMEFLLFLGITILIFLAVLVLIQEKSQENRAQLENAVLEDFSLALQQEFFTAAIVRNGYERRVELPENLNGKNYSIYVLNNNLYVEQDEFLTILGLPVTYGNLNAKTFTLNTQDGEVYIS